MEEVSLHMIILGELSEPRAEPIYETLQIDGKQPKTEVDMGVSVLVVSEATYRALWGSG